MEVLANWKIDPTAGAGPTPRVGDVWDMTLYTYNADTGERLDIPLGEIGRIWVPGARTTDYIGGQTAHPPTDPKLLKIRFSFLKAGMFDLAGTANNVTRNRKVSVLPALPAAKAYSITLLPDEETGAIKLGILVDGQAPVDPFLVNYEVDGPFKWADFYRRVTDAPTNWQRTAFGGAHVNPATADRYLVQIGSFGQSFSATVTARIFEANDDGFFVERAAPTFQVQAPL